MRFVNSVTCVLLLDLCDSRSRYSAIPRCFTTSEHAVDKMVACTLHSLRNHVCTTDLTQTCHKQHLVGCVRDLCRHLAQTQQLPLRQPRFSTAYGRADTGCNTPSFCWLSALPAAPTPSLEASDRSHSCSPDTANRHNALPCRCFTATSSSDLSGFILVCTQVTASCKPQLLHDGFAMMFLVLTDRSMRSLPWFG